MVDKAQWMARVREAVDVIDQMPDELWQEGVFPMVRLTFGNRVEGIGTVVVGIEPANPDD